MTMVRVWKPAAQHRTAAHGITHTTLPFLIVVVGARCVFDNLQLEPANIDGINGPGVCTNRARRQRLGDANRGSQGAGGAG